MTDEIIYVYCVTQKEPKLKELENLVNTSTSLSFNPERSGGIEAVYFIYQKGLYAMVSKVSTDEFSEDNLKKNLANMEWIKAKARIHEKIIEGVMKDTCVVPFKFATLFNNEESLKAMLEEHAVELKTNLEHLKGREEWGVKIYCDMEKLKKNLTQENESLLKISKEISASLSGKAFFLKKKKEELLNTAMNKKINEYGQYSFDRLREQSLEARINKLLPKEVTERKDNMILNAAFLVEKEKARAFIDKVGFLEMTYEDDAFLFDCTGPWPPYNFCQTQTINKVERRE